MGKKYDSVPGMDDEAGCSILKFIVHSSRAHLSVPYRYAKREEQVWR